MQDWHKYGVVISSLIAIVLIALIVTIGIVGSDATRRTNNRLHDVQLACIAKGGSWIDYTDDCLILNG